jgi:hypothetical protein
VKFCDCAGIFAAPREIWASALKANKPASKIAAVAIKVTVSLRISVLHSLAKTVSHKKHFAKRGHSQFQKGPLNQGPEAAPVGGLIRSTSFQNPRCRPAVRRVSEAIFTGI